ncbi:unnamed protein product, partial [Musa textilis]
IYVKFFLFLGRTYTPFVRSISLFLHESYACYNRDKILSILIDQEYCVNSFE